MKRLEICLLMYTAQGVLRGEPWLGSFLDAPVPAGPIRHVLDLAGALTGPPPSSDDNPAPGEACRP